MHEQIKQILLVASGKGGVGKSTLACNLAVCLQSQGLKVGLLDADIYGPSLPTMLGKVTPIAGSDDKNIQPPEKYGLKLMSMGYLVAADTAMIWRGPMLAGAATQLLGEVAWGALDVLVVDLPPGTGDVQLSLAQKFRVSGAVLCSTPQTVALDDVVRAKTMLDKLRVPILGLVENMSYFVCEHCAHRHSIFAHGGAANVAKQLNVDFLGEIPLESKVRQAGDSGMPVVLQSPDAASSLAYHQVAKALWTALQAQTVRSTKLSIGGRRSLPIVSAS